MTQIWEWRSSHSWSTMPTAGCNQATTAPPFFPPYPPYRSRGRLHGLDMLLQHLKIRNADTKMNKKDVEQYHLLQCTSIYWHAAIMQTYNERTCAMLVSALLLCSLAPQVSVWLTTEEVHQQPHKKPHLTSTKGGCTSGPKAMTSERRETMCFCSSVWREKAFNSLLNL